MMSATFIQMVAFMIYKLFFQERLEDQSYLQGLNSNMRRNMKKINMEVQQMQLGLELEAKKGAVAKQMKEMRSRVLGDNEEESALSEKMMIELR